MLGDVVGKGTQAALTHSGIAAAWESQIQLWESGQISAAELVKQINETMFQLFDGTMNTTFSIAEVNCDGTIKVASGGSLWLHINRRGSKPIVSRGSNLLGLRSELDVVFKDVSLEKGDWMLCFSDGIIEGNRAIRRFLKHTDKNYEDLDYDTLMESIREIGRESVHQDDASILVLRKGQAIGKSLAA